MATWKLSPQYKKSAVEKMFFFKEGKIIIREEGFRWATFSVESDERPLTDAELKNEDYYELGCIDNDESWEMQDMTDGCWADVTAGNDKTTEEDLAEFNDAWEADWYSGVEAIGWSQDECEYYYYGPLLLTNEDTGEEFYGEPPEDVTVGGVPEATASSDLTREELANMSKELEQEVRAEQAQGAKWPFSPPAEEPELTDWFPVETKPAYKGCYEVLTKESSSWPFPDKADWTGKKWASEETVTQWRGLAKDPSK